MTSFIKLERFLLSHGWNLDGNNERFKFFAAPNNLGFNNDYRFHVLQNIGEEWYDEALIEYAKNLSQIYSQNYNDILNIIEDNLSIFSLMVQDENTNLGSLDFSYFNAISGTIRNSLESAAHFTIRNERQGNDNINEYAQYYVNNCKILQTEKGSFIAKIGLPSNLILLQRNLFSPSDIKAEQVNSVFIDVIDAINQKFFTGSKPSIQDIAEDEFLRNIIVGDHGFHIIKNIRSIYEKSIGKSLDYKLLHESTLEKQIVSTQVINKESVDYCKAIIRDIENDLKTEIKEFTGYVHVTRTRNAKKDKNHIELIETEFGNNIKISLQLSSELFQIAHQAQGQHKKIKVIAEIKQIGKTYSTDYSKISKFEII